MRVDYPSLHLSSFPIFYLRRLKRGQGEESEMPAGFTAEVGAVGGGKGVGNRAAKLERIDEAGGTGGADASEEAEGGEVGRRAGAEAGAVPHTENVSTHSVGAVVEATEKGSVQGEGQEEQRAVGTAAGKVEASNSGAQALKSGSGAGVPRVSRRGSEDLQLVYRMSVALMVLFAPTDAEEDLQQEHETDGSEGKRGNRGDEEVGSDPPQIHADEESPLRRMSDKLAGAVDRRRSYFPHEHIQVVDGAADATGGPGTTELESRGDVASLPPKVAVTNGTAGDTSAVGMSATEEEMVEEEVVEEAAWREMLQSANARELFLQELDEQRGRRALLGTCTYASMTNAMKVRAYVVAVMQQQSACIVTIARTLYQYMGGWIVWLIWVCVVRQICLQFQARNMHPRHVVASVDVVVAGACVWECLSAYLPACR